VSTQHSAAGSAAGYLHQIQLGLILLWKKAPANPGVAVALEALDDVEFTDDDVPVVLVQSKHSVHDETLTDRSEAVWKTLTIWMKLLDDAGADALPRLVLCATAHSAPDSAMAALIPEGNARDEQTALKLLRAVANELPGNARTRAARERFAALSNEQSRALVAAIDVLDGQTQVHEFDQQLHELIGMHAPDPESVEEFAARIYKWWMGWAAYMLAGRVDRVTGYELWAYVRDLHDLVARRRLTADADILGSEPADDEKQSLRHSTFVRQLQLVSDENELLDLAVHDFWRAREQRGRWDREGRLTPGELDRYDQSLREEWRMANALMRARLAAREHVDAERCAAGLELYTELQQRSTTRLRMDFHEPVITRGSLHGLADKPRIGWHPDYEILLDA
jgi:hypothetical protein